MPYTVNMTASKRLIDEPTWFMEWFLGVLATLAGLYFIIYPWIPHVNHQDISPTLAVAVSEPALFFYGLIMLVIGALHCLSLIKPLWPRSTFWRRTGTLIYFLLFMYFTVLQILTYPSRVIWLAMLFTTVVSGLIYIRLRLIR